MKSLFFQIVAMTLLEISLSAVAGTYVSNEGNGFMSSSSDAMKFDETGKHLYDIDRQTGEIKNRSNPFVNGTSTPTKQFCESISEQKAGHADKSKPCNTAAEARAEAYAKIACKVAEDPDVEWSSGIVQKHINGHDYYYPVEPIKGEADHVKISASYEGMHYHPNGNVSPSFMDFASANGCNVPQIVLTRDNGSGSVLSTGMVRMFPDGTVEKLEIQNGTISRTGDRKPMTKSDSLSDLCSIAGKQHSDQQLLNDMISAKGDVQRQKDIIDEYGHEGVCFETPIAVGTVDQEAVLSFGAARNRTPETNPVDPASRLYTIDNTAMKQYMAQQLESAYSMASAMAAEAGVGAEYQSAVAPAVNHGRSAISSIPDKQTITVPAGTPTR